jgi:phospholipase C
MDLKRIAKFAWPLAMGAALVAGISQMQVRAQQVSTPQTSTPIEHVIVIIGENHTFDNVFGTYTPGGEQRVSNLISKGIVKADGSPGPKFGPAAGRT